MANRPMTSATCSYTALCYQIFQIHIVFGSNIWYFMHVIKFDFNLNVIVKLNMCTLGDIYIPNVVIHLKRDP